MAMLTLLGRMGHSEGVIDTYAMHRFRVVPPFFSPEGRRISVDDGIGLLTESQKRLAPICRQ